MVLRILKGRPAWRSADFADDDDDDDDNDDDDDDDDLNVITSMEMPYTAFKSARQI